MLERKGFGIRLGAHLIDGVIIAVLWQIVWAVVKPAMPDNILSMTTAEIYAWAEKHGGRSNMILGLFGLAIGAIEFLKGQTPGKMLLKLRVQGEAGTPATQQQMIRRCALKYGMWVFYLIGGLLSMQWLVHVGQVVWLVFFAGSFVALGGAKQALHDILGKTAVFGPGRLVPAGFAPVMQGQPPYMPPPGTGAPPPPQA
ncbi:RDD family protein [Humisphaera borealis]|uniref:RDD family protein n=1 Tax=Humisphaera borealis TaxID=2807512 RepID=A0A7M2WVW4_9BACT|nr:RDD family protein [Humisphaera borealis]QOV88991.1 RDD family protein [Humisphaera borealis]